MTKEDAIKTLKELRRETNDPWYEEVYDMAINALEIDRRAGPQTMLIEEAILHCEEVAICAKGNCADEHRQLAEWLVELKERRAKDEPQAEDAYAYDEDDWYDKMEREVE